MLKLTNYTGSTYLTTTDLFAIRIAGNLELVRLHPIQAARIRLAVAAEQMQERANQQVIEHSKEPV